MPDDTEPQAMSPAPSPHERDGPLLALLARLDGNSTAEAERHEDPSLTALRRTQQEPEGISPNEPARHGTTPPTTLSQPSTPQETRQRSRSVFESETGASSPTPSLHAVAPGLRDASHLAQRLKRARRLGPQSETDLDVFLAASSFEREAQQFAVTLECREMLKLISAEQEYRMPETLKRTAQDYAWAYMLSPAVMSYRAVDAPQAILTVMRQLSVAGIPPAHETARCEIIITSIGKSLTDCRHYIKDKVNETLKDGYKGKKDIGSLTAAITGRCKVKPTAALYMRIAAVRWAIKEYPKCAADTFWLRFDEKLAEWRRLLQTPVKIQAMFEEIYKTDKETFGEPDLLTHPTLNPNHQAEWILALNSSAGRTVTTSTAVSSSARRRTKYN